MSARAGERREIRCPADGTLVAEVDEAGPAGHRRGDRRGARAPSTRALAAHVRARARRPAPARVADLLERDADDVARGRVARHRQAARRERVRRRRRRLGLPPLRPGAAAEDAGRVVDTGNPDVVSRVVHEPVGVCGLITPVELPAAAASVEGRALPRRRQHLRAQAQRAHAAHRDPPDAPPRGGRAARGRRQPRARRRAASRARRSPRTRASTWSRSPAGSRPGRRIMAAAAATVKKVALELGGKNPNIVFADADLEVALDFALTAVFLHSGQVCSAGARLLVEESIHDEFVDELVERAGRDPARRPVRRQGRDRPADQRRAPRQGRGVRRRAGSPRAPCCAAAAARPTTRRWPTASTTCRRSSTAARPACRSPRTSRSARC